MVGTFGGVLEGNLLDAGFLEVEHNVPEEAEVEGEGFFTETGASKSVDSDEKTYGTKAFLPPRRANRDLRDEFIVGIKVVWRSQCMRETGAKNQLIAMTSPSKKKHTTLKPSYLQYV